MTQFDHVGINEASFDYNPASQVTGRIVNNSSFQMEIPTVTQTEYEINNLNQYESVGSLSVSHDLTGNLTNFDSWTYTYNAHNRLTKATKSGTTLDLTYDPKGRLASSTLNGSKTNFLYDGDELVAEYNNSGTLINRYVHGIGTDDPLVWYTGSGTSNSKYLLADERGSIIAETSSSGTVAATHKYGPYGEPINSSTSRFRYTGQILLPGTELYYYKARIYHPKLGRFMQTDPIGYDDGMNWYAYVGNDPVNHIDPSGNIKLVVSAYKTARRAARNGWDFKKAGKDEIAGFVDNAMTLADGQFTADDVFAAIDILTGFGDDLGVIYKTYKTESSLPYIGRANNVGERALNARDGRDRDGADIIGFFKKGKKGDGALNEQNSMNANGGVGALDNKRNEIAPKNWSVKGVVRVSGRIESNRLKKLDK